MKFNVLLTCFLTLVTLFSFGQIQGDGGAPRGKKIILPTHLKTIHFDEPNIAELRAEDAVNDAEKTGPWRFGYNHDAWLNMTNSGRWYDLKNGGRIWVAKLQCENALTVNLTFKDVKIPEGNELYVYNADKSFILGKFTSKHLYNGQLGTELIPGDLAVVEYYVAPENSRKAVSLTIEKVTHGYRTAKEFAEKAFESSGSCNMNVNCPDGALWDEQKRSVVMLVSGSNGFCTGALVNNTANDGKPYVLTANHCYSNPTNWIFRFNWESATCTNPSTEPTFQSLSGAVLRSRRTPSDFCLVEITGGLVGGTVPSSYNAYFSGWDNTGTVPTTTVCIHHPAGDIKKISFDDNAAVISQGMGSSEANSTWQVSWDRNTTTEGGSSGSPLFDQNHRIIGQLWGGGASCSQLSAADYYGRLANSWEPSGSDQTNQLKHWLDPSSSGTGVIDGYDPNMPTVTDDAGIHVIQAPVGTLCSTTIQAIVMLKNYGTNALTSVDINYQSTGVAQQTYNWTGNLASGDVVLINLPVFTAQNGAGTFTAETVSPNGVSDNNTLNDIKSTNFTAIANGIPVNVTIQTDCYGYETYWRILDDATSTVVWEGGNQDVELPGGEQSAGAGGPGAYSDAATVNVFSCLPEGCYTFEIYDDYGDGMTSTSSWGCSASSVGYSISDSSSILASMGETFDGNSDTLSFCLGDDLGIEELEQTNFEVYPNPNNGQFSIVFPQGIDANYTISVIDLTGRVLYSTQDHVSMKQIDLTGFASGKYLVHVQSAEFSQNKSIIIR